MGLNYQGILGNWSGKVGNVVGRVRRGRTVLAVYQPSVAQPNTDAQLSARMRLSLVSTFLRAIDGFLRFGFPSSVQEGANTYWSQAMKINLRAMPFTGVYPNLSVDYNQCVLSTGRVEQVLSPVAVLESGNVSCTWNDNSGQGSASEHDKIAICAFNVEKGVAVYSSSAAVRSARAATLSLPSSWGGNNIYVWLSVLSEKDDAASKSVCLGAFSL